MPTALHKLFIHGPQIVHYALLPIGQMSEDAQESRNKDFKTYREGFSRKCTREETMKDVLNWLLVSSDPLISSLRQLPRKTLQQFSPDALQLLQCRSTPPTQTLDTKDSDSDT